MLREESLGTTPSEKYLAKLCYRSFLRLWSYPNPFTDRGVTISNRQGKELCDLLVVFDNHVIIFSDKSCGFPSTGDVQLDWNRWYKRAIRKSADQISGAERWLANFPNRIYTDSSCTHRLPLEIPGPERRIIHRVVVALGAGERAAQYFGGGSRGSLMLSPHIIGDEHLSGTLPAGPFRIGRIESSSYVHVFDDITLDLVLGELDTVSDFVRYLEKKTDFLNSGRLQWSAGEEDLLAYYLSTLDDVGCPSFTLPKEALAHPEYAIGIAEGMWDEYLSSEFYRVKSELQLAGAYIDDLIQRLSGHIIEGTLAYGNERTFSNHERNVRFLASEPRTQRAVLAHAILQKLATTPSNVRTSITVPSTLPHTTFVFLLLPRDTGESQHAYRKRRQAMLEAYAHVIKLRSPDTKFVCGIATESGPPARGRSEDLMSFDFTEWTDEAAQRAKMMQEEGRILLDVKERTIFETPNTERPDLAKGNRRERRKARALTRKRIK